MLHNVQNGQQGACETQQLTEAVEAKVDQIPCQVYHLRERDRNITELCMSFFLQIKEQINVCVCEKERGTHTQAIFSCKGFHPFGKDSLKISNKYVLETLQLVETLHLQVPRNPTQSYHKNKVLVRMEQ